MSILDKYGIKEVADVTFYQIGADGSAGAPVLYFDTLKVSTIEQTAENTSARGGKGNPELVTWDYNKEITVTLEDALFSAKSMAIMYGAVDENGEAKLGSDKVITKTVGAGGVMGSGSSLYIEINGDSVSVVGTPSYYKANGTTGSSTEYDYAVCKLSAKDASVIEISPDKFPGTYYVTGDTYARSEATGKDEFFQFILPKVKLLSEVTLTLEAEGDPTTFSMNLKVLKPGNGQPMMKLAKYTF